MAACRCRVEVHDKVSCTRLIKDAAERTFTHRYASYAALAFCVSMTLYTACTRGHGFPGWFHEFVNWFSTFQIRVQGASQSPSEWGAVKTVVMWPATRHVHLRIAFGVHGAGTQSRVFRVDFWIVEVNGVGERRSSEVGSTMHSHRFS